MLEFFATNAPDPHHWTLKSCFGAFLSVWVHLEPFRYCTKLAAKHDKLVQLMHKFRPRRLVRIFCNERSRSTLLDPKIMFWCVSIRSGVFGIVSLLQKTWCKSAKLVQLMQKFMPPCRASIFHNECSRSTPLDPKLMFCFVSFRFGAFGIVLLLHETCCKTRQSGTINAKVRATMSC